MKKLITCMTLAVISAPAFGVITDPSEISCLCSDDSTVGPGQYCPDGKFCPYRCTIDCRSTTWSSASTGYEKRTNATCDEYTGNCNKITEYRCAAGYYGSSSNGRTGCTACPSGSTSSAGSTSRSSCCTSASSGSDATGSWTQAACCYS